MGVRGKPVLTSRGVVGILVLLALLAVSGLSDATELSFGFRKSITIDQTQVSGSTDLTDFPLLFSVTDLDLRTTGNAGNVTSAAGHDLLFRALDDGTCGGAGWAPCTLDHEIEAYDGATGKVVAWVRIPTLFATSDTTIYIYYGNSDMTSPIENPTGVWDSNFTMVHHFRGDPTGSPPQMLDSTTHHIDGTANSGVAATTGQMDGALLFDGINDHVDIDPITPLPRMTIRCASQSEDPAK